MLRTDSLLIDYLMHHTVMHYSAYGKTCHYLNLYICFIFNIVNNNFNEIKYKYQHQICESTRDKNTMKSMIHIPHLELYKIVLQNAGSKSFFLFFAQLKLQGRQKKQKKKQ